MSSKLEFCSNMRASQATLSRLARVVNKLTAGTTEYIFYCKRAILFLSSSKILTPHPPLRPASVYPPPLLRGEDRLAGRRGGWGGVTIFWKTREIGLPSYSKICTLWPEQFLRSMLAIFQQLPLQTRGLAEL